MRGWQRRAVSTTRAWRHSRHRKWQRGQALSAGNVFQEWRQINVSKDPNQSSEILNPLRNPPTVTIQEPQRAIWLFFTYFGRYHFQSME